MRKIFGSSEVLGRMNRQIVLLRQLSSPDGHGSDTIFWIQSPGIWAEYKADSTSRENIESERQIAKQRITFRIYHTDEVDETMRVKYNGRWYDITALMEDELRQFLTIECEGRQDYDTFGDPGAATSASDNYGNTWQLNVAGARTGLYWVDSNDAVWEKD